MMSDASKSININIHIHLNNDNISNSTTTDLLSDITTNIEDKLNYLSVNNNSIIDLPINDLPTSNGILDSKHHEDLITFENKNVNENSFNPEFEAFLNVYQEGVKNQLKSSNCDGNNSGKSVSTEDEYKKLSFSKEFYDFFDKYENGNVMEKYKILKENASEKNLKAEATGTTKDTKLSRNLELLYENYEHDINEYLGNSDLLKTKHDDNCIFKTQTRNNKHSYFYSFMYGKDRLKDPKAANARNKLSKKVYIKDLDKHNYTKGAPFIEKSETITKIMSRMKGKDFNNVIINMNKSNEHNTNSNANYVSNNTLESENTNLFNNNKQDFCRGCICLDDSFKNEKNLSGENSDIVKKENSKSSQVKNIIYADSLLKNVPKSLGQNKDIKSAVTKFKEDVDLSSEILMEDCNKERLLEFEKRRRFRDFILNGKSA